MDKDFLQATVKFKKKLAKMGPEYVFVIPRIMIKNGFIKPGKTYEIYLKEVPDAKEPGEEKPGNVEKKEEKDS